MLSFLRCFRHLIFVGLPCFGLQGVRITLHWWTLSAFKSSTMKAVRAAQVSDFESEISGSLWLDSFMIWSPFLAKVGSFRLSRWVACGMSTWIIRLSVVLASLTIDRMRSQWAFVPLFETSRYVVGLSQSEKKSTSTCSLFAFLCFVWKDSRNIPWKVFSRATPPVFGLWSLARVEVELLWPFYYLHPLIDFLPGICRDAVALVDPSQPKQIRLLLSCKFHSELIQNTFLSTMEGRSLESNFWICILMYCVEVFSMYLLGVLWGLGLSFCSPSAVFWKRFYNFSCFHERNPINHKLDIIRIALNQHGRDFRMCFLPRCRAHFHHFPHINNDRGLRELRRWWNWHARLVSTNQT